MFVFEEVITYSAEAKTHLSQYACISPPNHRGGLMAKYELCPLGDRICPSTKLVVGLMNLQCQRDNPFSSNLFLWSLENLKKLKQTLLYYFTVVMFSSSSVLFGGFSTIHVAHFSYPDLFLLPFETESLKYEQCVTTVFNPITAIVLNLP